MIISRQTKKAYLEHFFPEHVGAMNEHTTDRIFDGLETMLEHLLHLPSGQRKEFAKTFGNRFIQQANFILEHENLACLSFADYGLQPPPIKASEDNQIADSVKHELTPLYKEGFRSGVAWSLANQNKSLDLT